MACSRARLITVKSAVEPLPGEDGEVNAHLSSNNSTSLVACEKNISRAKSFCYEEQDVISPADPIVTTSRANIFLARDSPAPRTSRVMLGDTVKATLQSTSTTLAEDEQPALTGAGVSQDSSSSNSSEVVQILDWFKTVLNQVGRNGKATLKDLKHAAKTREGFAENLFKLFDTDRSESISMQELVGGLGRLSTYALSNESGI